MLVSLFDPIGAEFSTPAPGAYSRAMATKADPDASKQGCAPCNGEPYSMCCGTETAPWIPVWDVNWKYWLLTWPIVRGCELVGHGLAIFFTVMYLWRTVNADDFSALEKGGTSQQWIWIPGVIGFGMQVIDSFLFFMSGFVAMSIPLFILGIVGGTGSVILMVTMAGDSYYASVAKIGIYMWLFAIVLTIGMWMLLSASLVHRSTKTHEDFKTFRKAYRFSGKGKKKQSILSDANDWRRNGKDMGNPNV